MLHKKYVTVIILKTIDGRDRKPVESFLKIIPKRLKHTVSAVCSDLYEEKIIVVPVFNYSKKLKFAYNYSHYLTSVFNSKITKQKATENLELGSQRYLLLN